MGTSYAVFCGIDVGKSERHAVGLVASGDRLYDKALPNDEARLRTVFDRLAAHGPVLIVVDQPNTIGALTANSNARCSFQPSPHYTTPPVAPTTTANEPKARNTTPPSSASLDADATSCLPCSRTRLPTNHPAAQVA